MHGAASGYIEQSFRVDQNDLRIFPNFPIPSVEAEEGMSTTLKEKRNILLAQAVVAPVKDFDRVGGAGFQDYMNTGSQVIFDERKAMYDKFYD